MINSEYLSLFLEESREHLQSLNSCILELENRPDDKNLLNEIFRSAHTIKGMSATMEFTTAAELTHEMENLLDLLRKGEMTANSQIIDGIFECIDTLEKLIDQISEGKDNDIDIKPLVTKLQNFISQDKEPETKIQSKTTELDDAQKIAIHEAYSQGLIAFKIDIQLKEGCVLKSARAYLIINSLEEIGEIIGAEPAVEDLEKEQFDLTFSLLFLAGCEQEKIEQVISSLTEIESFSITKIADAGAPSSPPIQEKGSSTEPEKKVVKEISAAESKKLKSGLSVRVDIDKLDSLLNLVGELVINKTRLDQIGKTNKVADLEETIESMDRVTTDLQSVVMKVRMVPIGQVFNRFPRMIRDLSHELNKDINLVIQGEDTELDRTVIDEIGDPLVHLLRNAVDHGIESPEERTKKGKNRTGEIKLIARHEGNNVVILVEDDGKGIDSQIIKTKAIEKGILSPDDAAKMDANDILQLIFLPGFSTAEKVTDVSGRGVGMDAVKNKIEMLGGMVDLETQFGSGSRFKIQLPLTLAIIQALLVNVKNETYAIPLSVIDNIITCKHDEIKTIQHKEVIVVREEVVPLVRLQKTLGITDDAASGENLYVIVVKIGERKFGVIVDNLLGQQEIVIKSLGKLFTGLKLVSGATILGNGQVALILDIASIVN